MIASGRRFVIRGTVQGVGFRPWVYRLASEHGIGGRIRNDAAGVVIDAFGAPAALDAFENVLQQTPPPAAAIRELCASAIPAERITAFAIDPSTNAVDREISIPADRATCPECLAEILDPANRRYRYAFTSCTQCGPRFTISTDVPYDRAATTMAAFVMCAECRREYDTPDDRRFHAEANACPRCGPVLTALDATGQRVDVDDAIAPAVEVLLAGGVVAIKGLGGFHLACDATSARAVERLRERKRRDEKPFAVMVRDLSAAAELGRLTIGERAALASTEHPIVLAAARSGSALAANVAPDSPLVGVLLPYTPLHHLLLRGVGRPLVMTSGNRSDEPIAFRTGDAVRRLAGIADLYVTHDRAIAAPCDDSVVRVIAGAPAVLRRARGHVPRPFAVSPAFERPVLACGAQLKSTFCLGVNSSAYLSQHLGDLDNVAASDTFAAEVERMQRFVGVEPAIVAHDLHPDYASTRYARARSGAITIAVQHHHAHVVSAMAEHGLSGPVIGVAYDGAGYGADGASWGGELLIATHERFDRISTLRPIPLAGGDMAIRQPWRLALAVLRDAFDEHPPLDAIPLFGSVRPYDLEGVQRLLASSPALDRDAAPDANSVLVERPQSALSTVDWAEPAEEIPLTSGSTPPGCGGRSPWLVQAHGAGRYFDAVGSIVLGRTDARYEGQIALALNGIVDPVERRRYGYAIDRRTSPWTIDLRPMIREAVFDVRRRVGAAAIAARFHNTLIAATAAVVRAVVSERGPLPVVLTGGCFQNPRLAGGLERALRAGCTVHLHRRVPPGDGGIALGQAVIAAAIARRAPREARHPCA